MSAFDRVRRVVTVLLVAATLLVAPQVAHAGFSRTVGGSMEVSTGTVPQPNVTGTWQCSRSLVGGEGPRITITATATPSVGLAAGVPTYGWTLSATGVATVTATGPVVLLDATRVAKEDTTWALATTLRPPGSTWTSAATVRTLTCDKNGNGGGVL